MKMLDVPQSGSIAGQTSSRNRFGQYRRSRAVPVNPNSSAQVAVRASLISNSQGWRDLTGPERESWNAYAGVTPVVDALGQTIFLTGFQQYVGVNSRMNAAGLATIATPPDGTIVPAPEAAIADTTAGAITINTVAGSAAGTVVQVFSSPPVSPGVTFMKDFRLTSTTPGPLVANDPILEVAQMVAKWGALQVGKRFFFRIFTVDNTGNASVVEELSLVIT